MTAVAWSAIGLLAASVIGGFYSFHTLVLTAVTTLGARIDAQGASISARIDAMNKRLGLLNARFNEHIGRHAG